MYGPTHGETIVGAAYLLRNAQTVYGAVFRSTSSPLPHIHKTKQTTKTARRSVLSIQVCDAFLACKQAPSKIPFPKTSAIRLDVRRMKTVPLSIDITAAVLVVLINRLIDLNTTTTA